MRNRALVAVVSLLVAFALGVGLSPSRAQAQGPIDPKTLPGDLRPWTEWVLSKNPQVACPRLLGGEERACAWPSSLELRVDEKGGRFTQRWWVEVRQRVALPGSAKRWPLDVKVGAARAVVFPEDAVPTIELPPGLHEVTGAFAWDSPPESLEVPPATGLLTLLVRGVKVSSPNRDESGAVWLSKTSAAETDEKLDVVVHRKVDDGVPLLLTTRIALSIAGKNREILLGKALPPGFVPLALDTPIPARLEPDGRLRVQARAGSFAVTLVARSEGPVAKLERPSPDGPWREGDEVWVFEARSDTRVVSVEGVPALDPQQTTLTDAWKRLPAYAMKLGATMSLVEKRRGDADPAPDQLALVRKLWLDFDGAGYTISDRITGAMNKEARLEMDPPTVLGRVAIGEANQFITHLGEEARRGVEVRQGTLSVSADSRYVGSTSDIPAVGWRHDFHQVSGVLHLPPGWRLFHASGPDDVPGTWVRHWSLFELFLAIVTALAVARLHGPAWGAVASVMLVLTYPEADTPKWAWVVLLAFEALARALPNGAFGRALRVARFGAGVALVLIVIPFLVAHVRSGVYPQLGRSAGSWTAPDGMLRGEGETAVAPEAPAAVATGAPAGGAAKSDAPAPPPAEREEGGTGKRANASSVSARAQGYLSEPKSNAQVYDPTAIVQTGPGLPTWSWSTIELKWSGPVDRGQRLHLVLLSPVVNLVLALLRAALMVVVVLRLLPWPRGNAPFGPRVPAAGAAALAVLAAALVSGPGTARADIPSDDLLKELEARLRATPTCGTNCASSGRMLLEARGEVLRVRLDVDASAPVAVPLPGSAAQWSPSTIQVDGQPARALQRKDGKLWLLLAPGAHQVLLDGALPPRELVQLALPLKPHRVEASLDGWTLEGLHEDGLADDNLQLTRTARRERGERGEATSALQPGALPPFLRVERTLRLGLNWQVETRVVRVSPPGSAIVVEVPLLPGESVTTADVRVAGGKAQLNMSSQATEATWKSVLDQKSPLRLEAKKNLAATEVWRLDLGPIWHAVPTGIPVVHVAEGAGLRMPEWRPWPGESVELAITRPEGVTGQSLTIDRSIHEIRPGVRATDATLTLSVRASRGLDHTLVLPEGAELEQVAVNGAVQPLRQDGRKLTVPIAPGAQSVRIAWREPRGIGFSYRTPEVDLGAPSVNAETIVTGLGARWVLFTFGPRLGPAVLFWSLLLVLLVVAFGLSRLCRVLPLPVATWQWMLLAIGLSQISIFASAFVVAWLVALAWRAKEPEVRGGWFVFDLRQLGLALLTLVALGVLVDAVRQGLLGSPAMQIEGNESSADRLAWYGDRAAGVPEAAVVLSVPMLVYRFAMLAWALWIAATVLAWLKWGFSAFVTGGAWQKPPAPLPPLPPVHQAYGPPGAPNPPGAWGPQGAAPPAPPAPPAPAGSNDEPPR